MKFDVKKTENCFADSRTYEYRLPVDNTALIALLDGFSVTVNERFRRPMFLAQADDGVRLKGVLRESILKASFPEDAWQEHKARFEALLTRLQEPGDTDG